MMVCFLIRRVNTVKQRENKVVDTFLAEGVGFDELIQQSEKAFRHSTFGVRERDMALFVVDKIEMFYLGNTKCNAEYIVVVRLCFLCRHAVCRDDEEIPSFRVYSL